MPTHGEEDVWRASASIELSLVQVTGEENLYESTRHFTRQYESRP